MAVTYTPNYNLSKYDAGDTGWDTGINSNFDIIDSTLADLQNQINDITNTLDPTYLRLDGTNTPTANISFDNYRIINLGDPVDDQDAVNLRYLQESLRLPAPIISGDSSVYENNNITNTIDNYDPGYSYSVSFSDPLLTGYISGDTIYINAGDITDNVDHTVTMSVTVTPITGIGLPSTTNKDITVIYVSLVADDAIILADTTYTADNLDEIYNGTLV